MPFPAVSFKAAILDHPYRLIESVYNNVHFDCSNLEYASSCDRTLNIRKDLQEDVENLLIEQSYIHDQLCKRSYARAINITDWVMSQRKMLSDACSSCLEDVIPMSKWQSSRGF